MPDPTDPPPEPAPGPEPDPPPMPAHVFRDYLSRILATRTDAPRDAVITLGEWVGSLASTEAL